MHRYVARYIGLAALALPLSAYAETDRLPSTTIGGTLGIVAGAGPSAKPLGVGFALGVSAAVQPMRADQRLGWSIRWSSLFQYQNLLTDATAARVSTDLRLFQVDVSFRARFAPAGSGTYLTGGIGIALLRANQPIQPDNQRLWSGGFATIGVDRYLGSGALKGILLSLDARFGLIGTGPTTIATLLTVGYGL